jgi:hypothetical protein
LSYTSKYASRFLLRSVSSFYSSERIDKLGKNPCTVFSFYIRQK